MYTYKIMIIDDQIKHRKYLKKFFTNDLLNENDKLGENEKDLYKAMVSVEFKVYAPQKEDILSDYIQNNMVDAYFIDVFLNREGCNWHLTDALNAISRHNSRAPIFMYSGNWQDKRVLDKVTKAFREAYPGKTPAHYYELDDIERIQRNFGEASDKAQIEEMRRERVFIKEVINKAYGTTQKSPFSDKGDIVILHLSDLQYGDKNMTPYKDSIYLEISRTCNRLKNSERIAGVDLLTITGDVSMNGWKTEFDKAEEDLKKLSKKLWPGEYNSTEYKERIMVVPGNHDYDLNFCTIEYLCSKSVVIDGVRKIDFDKAKDSLTSERKTKLRDYYTLGLQAYKDFAYEITGNEVFYGNSHPHLNYSDERYRDWGLKFIGINSCDGISAECTNGVAINNDESRQKIIDQHTDDNYIVVLSHHSPLFAEEMTGEEKNRFAQRCQEIQNLAQEKAGIWLGGHRHTIGSEERFVRKNKWMRFCEATTLCLQEKWEGDDFKVETIDGTTIESRRGFQIVILRKKGDSFESEVIPFFFDDKNQVYEAKKINGHSIS